MKTVSIIYRHVPQYRLRFYELLRERLAGLGIDLQLIYGEGRGTNPSRRDLVDLPWGRRIRNRGVPLGSRELIWQPCLRDLRSSDLVVVEQASRLLINYLLWAQQLLGIRKLSFWGHGENFQKDSASSLGEWIKRRVSKGAHWWFAYNHLSAQVIRGLGYPPDRITVVENSIDTRALLRMRAGLPAGQLRDLRDALGIHSDHVGIFSGGMYKEKELEYLLEACIAIREKVPDFHMLFLGAGPEAPIVESFAARLPWIHHLGPRFDAEKVPYFEISRVLLMPGAVGLAVLDSFCLGTPMVTVADKGHGPEIDYLSPGGLGWILPADTSPDRYADHVVHVLKNPGELDQAAAAGQGAAHHYTIERMVENFSDGIARAITLPIKPGPSISRRVLP
jgi:glycosyltransferase involved in cell wall biosynthesis